MGGSPRFASAPPARSRSLRRVGHRLSSADLTNTGTVLIPVSLWHRVRRRACHELGDEDPAGLRPRRQPVADSVVVGADSGAAELPGTVTGEDQA